MRFPVHPQAAAALFRRPFYPFLPQLLPQQLPLLWWVLRRLILYPLYLLQKGMKQLEEENLDYRIEYREKAESSEFQYIYDTFNQMAREIGLSREKDIKRPWRIHMRMRKFLTARYGTLGPLSTVCWRTAGRESSTR